MSTQTLPGDREVLYRLVWREPAERIAILYGISTEYLAKRCSELRIPRPLAGYWKAMAAGRALAIPILPELGKRKGSKIQKKTRSAVSSSTASLAQSVSPKLRKQPLITGNGYGLINDLKTYLPGSTVTSALAWVLKKPEVSAPIVGASRPDHLNDAIAALDIELSEEEIRILEEYYVPHSVMGHS